jgi:hypothetical protein
MITLYQSPRNSVPPVNNPTQQQIIDIISSFANKSNDTIQIVDHEIEVAMLITGGNDNRVLLHVTGEIGNRLGDTTVDTTQMIEIAVDRDVAQLPLNHTVTKAAAIFVATYFCQHSKLPPAPEGTNWGRELGSDTREQIMADAKRRTAQWKAEQKPPPDGPTSR